MSKMPWWLAQRGWGWWLQAGIAFAVEVGLLALLLPSLC